MDKPVYKRVLIKISGEALAGDSATGIDFDVLNNIAGIIKRSVDVGVQIAIIVGGGNFWRGVRNGAGKIDRTRSDHMGMLGTAINALGLADVLGQHGLDVRVQTAIEMRAFAEPYIRLKAINHLEHSRVVVFGCGMGNPFFSTDTPAVLRAMEIDADIALLAKNIDGIYDRDPHKFPDAVKFDEVSFTYIMEQHLEVIDSTAASMAYDNSLPVLLFGIDDPENIYRALMGEKIGTIVRR